MSNAHWELVALQGVQKADGVSFDLFVTLRSTAGEHCIPVPPAALLEYAVFQRTMLERLGVVYQNCYCEGRAKEHQDENWRQVCSGIHVVPANASSELN